MSMMFKMEKTFFAILIFAISTCSSQNHISGNYCYSFNAGDGNCIEFLKSHRFNWKSTGDLGTYYVGSGMYSFEDEELILNFDENSRSNNSILNIESNPEVSHDEVDFKFKILDNHNQPLPGVSVTVKQDSLLNFQTDSTGYLEVNSLTKGPKHLEIEISNLLGYQNFKFEVIPDSNKEIKVVLYPKQPVTISDRTIQFKVLSYTKDTLDLMNSSGQKQKFVRQ